MTDNKLCCHGVVICPKCDDHAYKTAVAEGEYLKRALKAEAAVSGLRADIGRADEWRARAEQDASNAYVERDAYKKAKEENDERFMTERDQARAEATLLKEQLAQASAGIDTIQALSNEHLDALAEARAEAAQLRLHLEHSKEGWMHESPCGAVTAALGEKQNPDSFCTCWIKDAEAALSTSSGAGIEAVRMAKKAILSNDHIFKGYALAAVEKAFPGLGEK